MYIIEGPAPFIKSGNNTIPMTEDGKTKPELIFVYNADSGKLNELKDFVHKVASPKTYQCNLCGLTFGATGMKKDWKDFTDKLGVPVQFLHKDEFSSRFSIQVETFPAVFLHAGSEISKFIGSDAINAASTLDELITLVKGKVKEAGLVL